MTMVSAGAIGGEYLPNGGVRCISGSHRPAILGDVLGIVAPDPHGRQNGQQRRCIVSPLLIVCRA